LNSSPTRSGPPDGSGRADTSFQGRIHRIILGPHGVRAGWRALNAIFLWIVFSAILTVALVAIPAIRLWTYTQNLHIMTPSLLLFGDGISALAAIFAGLVMARLEQRSFWDYGLPLNRDSIKRAAQGLFLGLAMVSALIGLIAAAHGFSLGERALAGWDVARYGLSYAVGFTMLAFFEEFSYRGYLQATLTSGVGFWPAAVVLAIFFAAIHLYNPGETALGLIMVACFGLLAAFSLHRTGGIWLAIGMHLAWDWGLTYLYSVPDSGVPAVGHLMKSSLHGSRWITGGLAGPEGSVFAIVVLAITAVAIHLMFPAKQKSL
jgi:membrane protease YdiL (CAAX protease family)